MAISQTNLGWDVLLDLSAHRGSLSERLTAAIRKAIRDGRLADGTALPPSRSMAEELGMSRWTVTQAYGQLVAESYLEARTGSATRVCWSPEPEARASVPSKPPIPLPYDLNPGRPDLRQFPRRRWLQALSSVAETASFLELDYAEPGGTSQLRTVLAAYLNRVRGAAVDAGDVHVCFGAGQAMLRICQALKAAGHTVIGVEDPGSCRLWMAAQAAGLKLVPLPVDDDGLVVSALSQHPEVRAVSVGTAHQCPLGMVLAPSRRVELLKWARDVDALIIEDDYDAEFRYDRPATAVMQGMDPRRVALLGSVSKTLGPAVGIGWVVTPPRWTSVLRADDALLLMPTSLNQLALAAMIGSGSYDRHLRAARLRFRARRAALIQALEDIPGCTIRGAEAGLHLLLELPRAADPERVLALAARHGLQASTLDEHRLRPDPQAPPMLVLGYGNLADTVIEDAVGVLARSFATALADGPAYGEHPPATFSAWTVDIKAASNSPVWRQS